MNLVWIGTTTFKRIKKAVTDSQRFITYDPINRPEVSNLILMAAMASNSTPEKIASEIGDAGAGRLKAFTAEALIEMLKPIRERRKEIVADENYLLNILREGNEKANEVTQIKL